MYSTPYDINAEFYKTKNDRSWKKRINITKKVMLKKNSTNYTIETVIQNMRYSFRIIWEEGGISYSAIIIYDNKREAIADGWFVE